jgi:hypothetical protein
MAAGFQFGTNAYHFDLALGLESPIEYETMTVETTAGITVLDEPYSLSSTTLEQLAIQGAAGQCPLRGNGR